MSKWIEVASSSPGGGWEWSTFDVRRISYREWAWSNQAGCSCNSFSFDRINYKTGTKGELIADIRRWNGGFGYTADALALIDKVQQHRMTDH